LGNLLFFEGANMHIEDAIMIAGEYAREKADAEIRDAIVQLIYTIDELAKRFTRTRRIAWALAAALLASLLWIIFPPTHPAAHQKAEAARFKYTKALTEEYEGYVALDSATGQLCTTFRLAPPVAGDEEGETSRVQFMRSLPSCEDIR
jgi:hypothetical protein